jgi:beta-galactosidase
MKKILVFLFTVFIGLAYGQNEKITERTRVTFNEDWKFFYGNDSSAKNTDFTDETWRSLRLPHDWSIENSFDEKSPATVGGGALTGGTAWYRKSFLLPEAEKEKNIFIDFDGIYRNSEVWINGHYLGKRPNGYISFQYELTPYLHFGSKTNVIAVKVDNSKQPNSRWYSGSGIYRNVWLESTGKVFVKNWGTYVTTSGISKNSASVHLELKLSSDIPRAVDLKITNYIIDAAKRQTPAQILDSKINGDSSLNVQTNLTVKDPQLWSPDHPYLYQLVTEIRVNGVLTDKYTTPFGIRSFLFDVNEGFLLNGKSVKINGVCDHHDLGCLGSAVYKAALARQLRILKRMGCNAIRTSHNPPAPELLDLCDEMGFIVMDEAFDMWKIEKNPFDYHLDWDQWHKKDLEDQILRDRNHPSVFIWSIGNEINEQWDEKNLTGIPIARELAAIVKSLDTTRPITSALNGPEPKNPLFRSGALDLIGFNYHHDDFVNFHKTFPGQKFIGTETVSAFETRGYYQMPADSISRYAEKPGMTSPEGLVNPMSSYDNASAEWGSTHEETLKIIRKNKYLSGQFIWTGFDYLGEPTPYGWPSHSSYFGIIDLAGFPKDVYYMYQSVWTNLPVLHIFPHWNWTPGQEIDIWAYYNNADEVELFVNGKSAGIRRKSGDDLHVSWKLKFEPGSIKAVSKKAGKIVLVSEIKTAGAAAKILLHTDRAILHADGNDMAFITAEVVDAAGNLVPYANNLIEFHVSGSASIAGVDNGNPVSLEAFRASFRKAFNGKCLAVVKSGKVGGNVVVSARAEGLNTASVNLNLSN